MNDRIAQFQAAKSGGRRVAVLTAYDYPQARLLEEGGIDALLVGDSLGMVVLGYPDTTLVTMDEMAHHTRAVARGSRDGGGKALILADLPYGSAVTPQAALMNASRLIEAGAHAVKLEGGVDFREHVVTLRENGIPVMAHIGMQPQRVRIEGGYRMKGKTPEQAEALLRDAREVETAGAFGLLLEMVVPEVAMQITKATRVPTIGIGSGANCDGQVLVLHDVIGLFPWFKPKFATQRANVAEDIRKAITDFVRGVRDASA